MLGGINNNLANLFNNNIFLILIKISLIYYIVFVSFKLNNELVVLFDNYVVKLLCIILIFYTSTYNIQISLLIMIGYIFSLNTLNNIKLNDLLNLNEDIEYLNTETETKTETETETETESENKNEK
tara:strand:- start:1797 stop:2174 length:378 start_codon:yes stop_codon:yes gene_type:complete